MPFCWPSRFGPHTRLRHYSTFWFDLSKTIDPQRNYQWLLVVIMPFGPILLDLQGFYQSPSTRRQWKSFVQIMRCHDRPGHHRVRACVIFLRLPLVEPIGAAALHFDRHARAAGQGAIIVNRIRRKAMSGEQREPVLLAGVPRRHRRVRTIVHGGAKIADGCRGQNRHRSSSRYRRFGRSDASPRGSRVIFAAGHSQLNRVEQAIGACEMEGVPAWVVADFIQTSIAKPDFDAFGGRPMLVFRSTPGSFLDIADQGNHRSGLSLSSGW